MSFNFMVSPKSFVIIISFRGSILVPFMYSVLPYALFFALTRMRRTQIEFTFSIWSVKLTHF